MGQGTADLMNTMVASLIIGLVLGMIPVVCGLIKKQVKMGLIGMVSCIVGSLLLGIYLAFPLAVFFVFQILKRGGNKK